MPATLTRTAAALLAAAAACAPLQPQPASAESPIDHAIATAAGPTEAARARSPGARARPLPSWKVVGHSVQGRPLRAATYGSGARRVLWIGGIHGNEREGAVATDELPDAFLAAPGGERAVTLTVLEDVNPDGSAMHMRGNANGVDLNRNFPADNFVANRMFGREPLSQPESLALRELITAVQPHLVLIAHSWSGDHFVNFDGPARELADRFAQLSGYPVRRSEDIPATPGSLGSWLGQELGVPVLTIEYLRGREPGEAWRETRDAVLAVVLDG
ncbi:MAG TPA: M14 family zinc carboxypeptidase [Burkholderiaceae bacterium]|nr:M14 family zinc carboxypeptidase [Burkholderiaceae bacterium]